MFYRAKDIPAALEALREREQQLTDPMQVRCGYCGAAPGQFCIVPATGKRARYEHRARDMSLFVANLADDAP